MDMAQRLAAATHPLDGQHINQGSVDAAADAYEREYLRDLLDRALGRAYSLGQTYWMQADSESYSQNRKADETQAKFDGMRAETVAKFVAILDHIDAQAAEIAEAKGQIEHLDRQNNALRDALQRLLDSYRRLKPPGYPGSDPERLAMAALSGDLQ